MNITEQKCVMVFNEDLSLGILTNTAAIMGITLGKYMPNAVGESVYDHSQYEHLGIIQIPVPILKTAPDKLKDIRTQLFQPQFKDLIVVDFSDIAQSCHVYDDYIKKASLTDEEDFHYFGIALCGPKKLVNKLTGSLPLLR